MPTYVFQYGSNCSAERLNSKERLGGSARDLGLATTVEPYALRFNVWSEKNDCATADLVPTEPGSGPAFGVLYDIPEDRVRSLQANGPKTLTQVEGTSYRETLLRVRKADGDVVDAVTFTVVESKKSSDISTDANYVRWIVDGLRAHGAPDHYVETVKATAIATLNKALPETPARIATIENL